MSLFSSVRVGSRNGTPLRKVRRRLFPKVEVTILEPVKLEEPAELKGRARRMAADAALYQVMSSLMFETTNTDTTVFERIIATADERGFGRLAVQDPLTYGKLLRAAAVLGAKFRDRFAAEKTLGVLLPNANGSVATVLGVMSASKVPAMLNFTAGAANLASACAAAEIRKVLTSHAFVDHANLGTVVEKIGRKVEIVCLDDIRVSIPDLKKGERLVMLTDAKGASRAAFLELARSKGAADMLGRSARCRFSVPSRWTS